MLLSKLGEHRSKAIGLLITISLVALLVLAGPANALSVSLSIPGTTPFPKGDSISIPGTVNINSNEIVTPSTNLTVTIHGPGNGSNDRVCNFVLHETDLDECNGVTIDLTNNAQNSGYGYLIGGGYGYGLTNGQISYVLFINTNKFDSGNYTIQTNVDSSSSDVQSFEIAPLVCTEVTFRSKGYWDNHPQFWAAKLPQTLGNEVVSTTARVAQIFQRTTKVDRMKAPLLALKFNLFDHPEAASFLAPNESNLTLGALASQADALLLTNPTKAQLDAMRDRLDSGRVTGKMNSCATGSGPSQPPAPICEEVTFRSKGYWDNHLSELATLLPLSVGNETVSNSTRAHQIFDRATKVDKVKAPLLAIKANLVNFPSAASLTAPGENVTVGDLAAQADALLKTSATTTQLSLMADRLNKVTGDLVSCPDDDD